MLGERKGHAPQKRVHSAHSETRVHSALVTRRDSGRDHARAHSGSTRDTTKG